MTQKQHAIQVFVSVFLVASVKTFWYWVKNRVTDGRCVNIYGAHCYFSALTLLAFSQECRQCYAVLGAHSPPTCRP